MQGNEELAVGTSRPLASARRWAIGSRVAGALIGVVAMAFGLSACSGGPVPPGVASTGSHPTTTAPTASSPSSTGDPYAAELRYSECMRSHGVADFPDPSAGGGFRIRSSRTSSSATFNEAQEKCGKLLPAGPGSGQPPTAQALAQMLKVSQCMRRHGISDFPDPRTSAPPLSPSIGEIADRDGVILVFPRGFNQQSPLFTRAAAACGFQLTNH